MNEINEIVIVLMISLVLILGGVIVYLVIEIVKVSKKESKNGIDHNIKNRIAEKVRLYSNENHEFYSSGNTEMLNDTMTIDEGNEKRPVIVYKQQEYPLFGPSFTVGRSSTNDIVINNKYVSKSQFVIMRKSDGYYLKDTSKNGCRLNGIKMGNNDIRLKNQDCIEVVGEMLFFFDEKQGPNN